MTDGLLNVVTITTVKLLYYGNEIISFLSLKLWSIVPDRLKKIDSQAVFKTTIKSWKPEKCLLRLCRIYTSGLNEETSRTK